MRAENYAQARIVEATVDDIVIAKHGDCTVVATPRFYDDDIYEKLILNFQGD